MQHESISLSHKGRGLLSALEAHGALRLNATPRFPNVVDLGAGWPEVMELVSAHVCFVSRLVDKATTYLSIPVFEACAALVSGLSPVDESSAYLLDLLEGNPMSIEEISTLTQASPSAVRQRLSFLQTRLLVTVFGPGRSLNPNWDTYVWCTREDWQGACPVKIRLLDAPTARRRLEECLTPYMSPSRVSRLINRLSEFE